MERSVLGSISYRRTTKHRYIYSALGVAKDTKAVVQIYFRLSWPSEILSSCCSASSFDKDT